MKTKRNGVALILASLLLLLAASGYAGSARAEMYDLPYFLNQFENTSLDLTQYWGKAYLLFFFTESSQESLQQLPELKKIYETYSPDALQIIMIHEWANETEENTQNLIREYGLENLTFFEDTDMSVAKKINIPGCPMTIFMDSNGFMHEAYVYTVGYDMLAEVLDSMGVPRGAPATPAPVETVAPATASPTSDVAINDTDFTGEDTAATAPAQDAATPVPFITKAPASTGSAPLTPPPGEGTTN